MNSPSQPAQDIRRAYAQYTLADSIRNSKVACILVVVLMPIGTLMDWFVYEAWTEYFFYLRLMTSTLAALVFVGLRQPGLREQHYRVLCTGWYLVPAFFISWMIYETEGVSSPYYAGLNLVILAVSSVIQATMLESLVAVTCIVLLYAGACLLHAGPPDWRSVSNNGFFLFCTMAIVTTGNYFYNRLRFREFVLRFELDENRQKLQETNHKLVELDQVKNRFFANISHELRTPLTLLLAPLETLIRRSHRSVDSESRELLSTMHSNGMRLLKLINDLLELVRLESGRMELKRESLAFGEFVRGLVSATRQVADDKKIRLESSIQPGIGTVMIDRDKLEKVLLNLVFNALKFTPAGGRVRLQVEKSEENLVLVVSDTGMGIAEKNLPYIFDRFWQADTSSKRKFQGAGIGLALVKELVELQGGKVGVESREGSGTTFTIRLPYLAAEAPAPPEPKPEPVESAPREGAANTQMEEWLVNLYRRAALFPALTPVQESLRPVETWSNSKRPRLLIADDEPDMLRFLKSQLSSEYQVLEAVDGQQAIEKACQFLPDMILLDMMMPEKDGLQACQELRERTPTQSIPIVLLTARADEETKLAALKAGASDFLPKPFSTSELHVRIRNLVEMHDYQRKLTKQNQLLERTIEQLKETESQLVESEKMRSLGQLSAGMIHEINNPLNYATTGLFALRSKDKFLSESERPEYLEILADVEEGVKRVKDLVCKMREFSYADNKHLETVEVSQVVSSALRFLSHEWKDKVVIHRQFAEGLTISANKNRMIQVLLNLLQNSLDALSGKADDSDKPAIWIEGQAEADRTLLIVRDNGTGIDPEHMDKIFDPFFTTKDVGAGMGLGLSICYRIVQDCGGRIHVRSEPGKCCEFRLEFPNRNAATAVAA